MYFNNAQCDIYIGTGAGKKLMEEISSARSSVKIVSPFLSNKLLDGLVALHNNGIRVELITTAPEQGGKGVLRKLIRQNVHMNRTAQHQRKVLKRLLWIAYALMGIGLMAAWFFFVQHTLPELLYAVAILGFFGLIAFLLRHIIRNKRVFSYSYEPIFPLRIIKPNATFGQRATYLHSKIYIIDDRIAYLGSLNFTQSGLQSNYETRVRLTDAPSVKKIVEEFHYLMEEVNFPEMDVQAWGSRCFPEIQN